MWRYYELLSEIDHKELDKLKKASNENKLNPRDLKMDLGVEIVSKFYSHEEAKKAKEEFKSIFQQNKIPENIETIDVDPMPLPNLLKHVGLAPSTSEARRLIGQKALKIDDHVVDSIDYELKKGSYILKLGKKKFAQVNVKK